jgi:ANTAR domain
MEHHPQPDSDNGVPAAADRRNGPTSCSPGLDGPAPPEPTRADLVARLAALEGQLVTLTEIEQAKGALMVTYGISADAAFALLRFHSQNRNVKVRAIAAQLTTLMNGRPSSTESITRFDRLLNDVALSLQPQPPPTTVENNASTLPARPARGGVAAAGCR